MLNLDPAKSTGALVGTNVGLLICKVWNVFVPHAPVDNEAQGAVIGLCIFLVSHWLQESPQNFSQPVKPA